MSISVLKSRKFENAKIIKGAKFQTEHSAKVYGNGCYHFFLDDIKNIDNKISIQYVFYSRNYRKWYQDTAYFSKDTYNEIQKILNK